MFTHTHTRTHTLYLAFIALLLGAVILPLTPVNAQDGGPTVVVNTGALHIRSGPAPNTTVLGTVPGGAELAVTGRTEHSTWWRVNSPFGEGWVNAEYVAFRGTVDAVPIVNQPVGTPEMPLAIIEGAPVTVYRNPDPDSFVVGTAPTGARLQIVAASLDGQWWEVSTSLGLGWVRLSEVAVYGDPHIVPRVDDPGPAFDGPTVRVNADTPVTSEPGGGQTLTVLPAGSAMPASGRTADNTYWRVAGEFGVGWIAVNQVSLSGKSQDIPAISELTVSGPGYTGAAVATAIVEAPRKVAYADYSYASDPMWDAGLGEQLSVTARSADGMWLEVVKKNGWTGWMHFGGLTLQGNMADLPIKDTTPVIQNIVIVNIHRLNIRSGPGVEYQALTSVPGGTTLNVTGRHPTLPWIRVEGDYGVGWVRIMYIIFRGNWAAVPRVTEPVGALEVPLAIVSVPHHVYSEPNWDYPTGTIQPELYPITGWTSDYRWARIQTPLGEVWLRSTEFEVRGIRTNAPVVQ